VNVVLLHEPVAADARADECDVLPPATAVARALDELGHTNRAMICDGDMAATVDRLHALRADVVFNLVESLAGKGRGVEIVPAALAAAGLPFTGNDAAATVLTNDKVAAKERLVAHGLPTPAWATLGGRSSGPLPTGRYIVKSVWEHGSLGLEADSVVTVTDAAQLQDEIERRLDRLGGEAFAEAYVHGREFNLGLLAADHGVEHLPPAEILFAARDGQGPRIVGYRAKWDAGSADDLGTPRSFAVAAPDRPLIARMQHLARAVWDVCGLAGYARVDLRVDEAGEPWIIDINTNPCISPDAGYAAAVAEAGLRYADAVQRLLDAALRPRG